MSEVRASLRSAAPERLRAAAVRAVDAHAPTCW